MTRTRYASWGRTVYPAPGASRKGQRVGRTPWRRCRQCGMPNDTRKTGTGAGDGITVAASDASTGDPTVTSGCRFCGSLSWTKAKSRQIKDGSLTLPFLGWRRKRRNT